MSAKHPRSITFHDGTTVYHFKVLCLSGQSLFLYARDREQAIKRALRVIKAHDLQVGRPRYAFEVAS